LQWEDVCRYTDYRHFNDGSGLCKPSGLLDLFGPSDIAIFVFSWKVP
jgi:hypothetical protein